jgi:hypothetical protein
VSFVAENLEADGPVRGCLIAAVARSVAGMPEDSGKAAESGTVDSPCPVGLVTWLQTVGGDDDGETAEDSDNGGPPDFVRERGGGPPASSASVVTARQRETAGRRFEAHSRGAAPDGAVAAAATVRGTV